MLRIFKSRESKVVQQTRENLRSAVPTLKRVLATDIDRLDTMAEAVAAAAETGTEAGTKLGTERGTQARARPENRAGQIYVKRDLARVLKAAANVHLKLKLGKAPASQLSLVRYLNPLDPSATAFAQSCLRVMVRLEDTDAADLLDAHLTELRNVYIYLLSRLDEL